MSKFKSIRELDPFDNTTPFNTADWLAVADANGTTTRKISAADLVNAVGSSSGSSVTFSAVSGTSIVPNIDSSFADNSAIIAQSLSDNIVIATNNVTTLSSKSYTPS